MRAGSRNGWLGAVFGLIGVVTLLLTGCSKPEEVIRSRVAVANQKLDAGEVDDVLDILEPLNRKYPDHAEILEVLGFADARAGRHADAAASFVQAADLDASRVFLRQMAAEAFIQAGEPQKAAEQHRLYLAKYPDDFQGWQKLGEILEQLGDTSRAIDAYLEWYRLRPSGECAYRIGAAFRKLNNSPQAKTWFETTIKHGTARVKEALLGLLELEVEAGNLAAAEQTTGQLDKNFPGALDSSPLTGVRQRIAAWKKANAALNKAREEQRRLAQELEDQKRARLREIEEEAKQEEAAKIAQTAPTRPQAQNPQEPATTPPQLEVEPEITEVLPIETPPSPSKADLPPELRAAIERKESGDVQGAVEMLWRALGADDSRVPFWTELADCYRALKQYQPAEACILEARRRKPDSIEVETAYLNIVRESQPEDVYLARVEAARKKFPDNANLAYVFARELASAEGDAARTISAYEDFLLLADPRDPRRAEAARFLSRARR